MKEKIEDTKNIIKGIEPIYLNEEELKQIIKKPLIKARYSAALKKNTRRPRETLHKKIVCETCRRTYTQSNVSHHKKSKHHIFCEELNKKWLSILYD